MLRELTIRNVLLIDALDLDMGPGLNVLTGETGAGKSILLDCLGMVLGWRGRADVVRSGASEGEVTAIFALSEGHKARAVLEAAGLPVEDELLLRRVASADGRKKAFANDRRVSGETLRALSECLVELHGQQDDGGLLSSRGHRALLDDFGGHAKALAACRSAWAARRVAQTALSDAQEALAKAAADRDYLDHAVKELAQLSPQPGEDAELDERRRLMQAAQRIQEDVLKAAEAIGGSGAQGRTADAVRWLEGAAARAGDHLNEPIAALSRALTELGEAERGIEDVLRAMTGSPAELEMVEERLFAIRALARKHQVQPDDLAEFADDLAARLDAIDTAGGRIAALEKDRATTEAAYDNAADVLSRARQKAAKALDKAMAGELAPLKLERASFATLITRGDPGPDGHDTVEFQVSTNPGTPPGPLNRIASGGELSRFLLAMKVCLSRAGGQTLIFDEIDRGVGGATADAVGRRLAALSETAQVLVVTHSPQVAARGQDHWQVSKSVTDGVTRTDVRALDRDERVDELARMLAGDTISDAARSAALVLLDG